MKKVLPLILFFASATFQAAATQTIVSMTGEGLAPREVSVTVGSVVRFVNADTVQRWPASNVHPSHSLYPAFDPRRPIAPGAFWEFRFDIPGTWRYHDHLLPHQKGTIVVRGESLTPAVSWWEAIRRRVEAVFWRLMRRGAATNTTSLTTAQFLQMEDHEQYRHIDAMLGRVGAIKTWEYIVSAFRLGGDREGNAHNVAHFFGAKLFDTQGRAGLAVCTPDFAFGCYHGFFEAALSGGLSLLASLAQTCQHVGVLGSGPWASCIHGLGHGVATYYDTVELGSALATCDGIEAGQTYCHDGVFMEFVTHAPASVFASSQKSPLDLCRPLNASYHFACGRNLPALFARQFSRPAVLVAPFCEMENNDMDIQRGCIEGIGLHIGQTSRGSGVAITEGCRILQDPARYAACVTAAAGELVFQNTPGWQDTAPASCRTLPPAFTQPCLARVADLLREYR